MTTTGMPRAVTIASDSRSIPLHRMRTAASSGAVVRVGSVPIDGLCVRIGAMRCHSQAVTIKLRHAMPVAAIERAIGSAHDWIRIVPNEREASLARLTPAAVTGTLDIAVGRIRHLAMGEDYVTAFTVGDQLLWGAAEPLRRMLRLLIRH